MDYFIKNDSAITATDEAQLEEKLRYILENPDVIEEYGKKAFDCAKRNHDKELMDQRFIETVCRAVE
jgi:hypothetical protein